MMISKKLQLLKSGETLDDLQRDGLYVIQSREHYRFSIDSVLLSDFVKAERGEKCVELCSGSGVVSILVNAKCHPHSILGIEMDEYLCDMSMRSLEYNEIDNITFVASNLSQLSNYVDAGTVDVVFSNPPYLSPLKDMSRVSKKFHHTKYETTTSLDDIMSVTENALKFGGRFYVIYSSMRVQELLSCANGHNLFVRKMQFIYFKSDTPSPLVLCEFIKGKQSEIRVCPPLFYM